MFLDINFEANWPLGWQLVIYVVAVALGVFCLVKFCNIFVDAASSIAHKFKIPPMIIGLTVVAMGTSCPELAVSAADSIGALMDGGNANVAMGNVVGSNICNILLVLGFSIIFTPIIVKRDTMKRDFPVLLGASALLVLFGLVFSFNGQYAILRWEGIIYVIFMIAYLTYLVIDAKKHPQEDDGTEIKEYKTWLAILLVIVGAAGVVFGGEAVVFGAKGLALKAAVAAGADEDKVELVLGLTLVAVGTSLPELVTSVIAAKKGQSDMALGNVIGSNIFNILFVLGISATINPIVTGDEIVIDLIVMMSVAILLFGIAFITMLRNKEEGTGKLGRGAGILFVLLYVAYLTYLVLRAFVLK